MWTNGNEFCTSSTKGKQVDGKRYCSTHIPDKSLLPTCSTDGCKKRPDSKMDIQGKRYCVIHSPSTDLLRTCDYENCNKHVQSRVDSNGKRYCINHTCNTKLISKCCYDGCDKHPVSLMDQNGKRYCHKHSDISLKRTCDYENCDKNVQTICDERGKRYCNKHCNKINLRTCDYTNCSNLAKSKPDINNNRYCQTHLTDREYLSGKCNYINCKSRSIGYNDNNERTCKKHGAKPIHTCSNCYKKYYRKYEFDDHLLCLELFGNCNISNRISQGERRILKVLLDMNLMEYHRFDISNSLSFIHDKSSILYNENTGKPLRFDFVIIDKNLKQYFIEFSPPGTHDKEGYRKFMKSVKIDDNTCEIKFASMLHNYNLKKQYAQTNGVFIELTKLNECTYDNIKNILITNGFEF
jgi:hypothetical protein